MHDILIFVATFVASAVEMVEALTIVLAVGVTRGWRAAGWGVGSAVVALAVIVAALGPALTELPIDALRIVVGTLLLIFGLQWLRKAVLRASGLKAMHDEDAIYEAEVDELRSASPSARAFDWYAFTISFKGVFLEGLEVAFIVVTAGLTQDRIGVAAAGAGLAVIAVLVAGALVHRPLSRVPENTMKFAVGVMLTSFGIFWSAEGAGADWPGGEAAIAAVGVFVAALAVGLVVAVGRRRPAAVSEVVA